MIVAQKVCNFASEKSSMSKAIESYQTQKKLATVAVLLFLVKIIAWYLTNSVAILTDTLEYTINVISSFVGLYSLRIASMPRDANHPYGHGKVEFLSAAVEGTLMIASSFLIIFQALGNLVQPHSIVQLDYGIYLVAFTAVINYGMGEYAIRTGKKNSSLALIASGKHLKSDTYATIGIVTGLILIYFTNLVWIDSLVAIIFSIIIVVSGYKILRSSVAGIMDEADEELLEKIIKSLQAARKENWIDMHNLRIIKYGETLHFDCHLTVPWYLNVHEAHKEIDDLADLIKKNFGESVELFVHTDGCLDFSCKICSKSDCKVRVSQFEKKINWSIENISNNKKHNAEM